MTNQKSRESPVDAADSDSIGSEERNVLQYIDGTVQIMGDDDTPVGMGILVEPLFVITCAHVLNAAIGRDPMVGESFPPDRKVELASPYSDDEKTIGGEVVAWYGPKKKCTKYSDFAVVKLFSAFPGLKSAVFVKEASKKTGQEMEAFGYPPATDMTIRSSGSGVEHISDYGNVAYCRSTRLLGRGRVGLAPSRLEDKRDSFLRRGFSGAHLYAERQQAALGMAESVDRIEDNAFMVPTETILLLYPEGRIIDIVHGADQ